MNTYSSGLLGRSRLGRVARADKEIWKRVFYRFFANSILLLTLFVLFTD